MRVSQLYTCSQSVCKVIAIEYGLINGLMEMDTMGNLSVGRSGTKVLG